MGRKNISHSFTGLIGIVMVLSFLSGCSTLGQQRVKPGDYASVSYTCRLRNGEVVLTTSEATARDNTSHASIFLPFKKYGPGDIIAGGADDYPKFGKLKMFENEVSALVAKAVVGMKPGENNTIVLKSEVPSGLTDGDRYITLGRTVRKEKEQKVSLVLLKDKLGHVPVVGEKAFSFQGFTGIIKSITDKEAVIRIEVKDGQVVGQPFSKGIIKDFPDHYDIVTDAKVGTLVRTATQVGRIISVADDKFTIDYGHPFGGEELMCDVRVESIIPKYENGKEQKAKDGIHEKKCQ
jgi:FKBP-type peptidyl-prolyl cis-trans isomerase 2